jgi:hypothetical protein
MARRPRVHFPGALYYVISRGNQRQKISKVYGTGFEHDVVGSQAIRGGDCNGHKSADADGAAVHPPSLGTTTKLSNKQSLTRGVRPPVGPFVAPPILTIRFVEIGWIPKVKSNTLTEERYSRFRRA